MANNKSLNTVFGNRAVTASQPDRSWPLESDFVGIEIEVEAYDGDSMALLPEWVTHVDHSLRNGLEFVTSAPVGGQQLTATINKFFSNNHTYNITPRTSVHIHVNASDNMTVEQFRNMLVLMYVIEPAVFRWADENRKWCGYCAPLTDIAPNRLVTILNENEKEGELVKAVRGENGRDRYFGFNISAYAKHGTVEFRYFPCTNNRDTMVSWVKFAMMVKRAATQYETVNDMLTAMDGEEQLRSFVEHHFDDVSSHITSNLDWMDASDRVRELLSSVHVKPVNAAKTAIHSVDNPALHRLVGKKWPDYKYLLEKPKEEPSSELAYRTLNLLLSRGRTIHEAVDAVQASYGTNATVAAIRRHNTNTVQAPDEEGTDPRLHFVRNTAAYIDSNNGYMRWDAPVDDSFTSDDTSEL